MRFIRSLLRPLLAWVFVHGGIDVLRKPGPRAEKAEGTVEALSQVIPAIPADPVMAVKVNAIVQVGAGTLLATGRFPRLSAAVLAASLVPTTVAGHPFWEEDDPRSGPCSAPTSTRTWPCSGGCSWWPPSLATLLDGGGQQRPAGAGLVRAGVGRAVHR